MRSPSSVPHPQRRRGGRRRGGWLPFSPLAAAVLLAAAVTMAPTALRHVSDATDTYHDGVFSQAAPRFCTSTDVFTASNRIRTKIVRHSDGWSNTISSRYRKWVHCTARQMTPTMWCTTKLVDGFSGICITPQPRAAGTSPCPDPALDVRSVYFPHTGRLAITCVNRASPAGGTVSRTDPRGDASPARLDILGTRVTFNDRITVRTHLPRRRARHRVSGVRGSRAPWRRPVQVGRTGAARPHDDRPPRTSRRHVPGRSLHPRGVRGTADISQLRHRQPECFCPK